MEPVDGGDPLLDELLAPVGQQLQYGAGVVSGDDLQAVAAQTGHGDRVGVGIVGLATAATTQRTNSGGQVGRHVQHPFLVGGDPLGQAQADAAGPFDGPGPRRPGPGEPFELEVAAAVVGKPLRGQDVFFSVEDERGVAALVRVDADHYCCHAASRGLWVEDGGEGSTTSGVANPSWATPRRVGARRETPRYRATRKRGQSFTEPPRRAPDPQPGRARGWRQSTSSPLSEGRPRNQVIGSLGDCAVTSAQMLSDSGEGLEAG